MFRTLHSLMMLKSDLYTSNSRLFIRVGTPPIFYRSLNPLRSSESQRIRKPCRSSTQWKLPFARIRVSKKVCPYAIFQSFLYIIVFPRGLEPFASLDKHSQAIIERNKDGLDWERIAEKVHPLLLRLQFRTTVIRSPKPPMFPVLHESVKFAGLVTATPR